jgi:hypothetical protein
MKAKVPCYSELNVVHLQRLLLTCVVLNAINATAKQKIHNWKKNIPKRNMMISMSVV